MFNIPELELHDISPILFLGEAETSSTAGNLLHFPIASPASPLENSRAFHASNIPMDPQARSCPKSKRGASP